MVSIEEHSAYWTSIFGLGLGGGDDEPEGGGPTLLVIRGQLRNRAGRSLDHVKVLFELVDSRHRVVASEYGYNLRAETLRPIDSPIPVELTGGTTVQPIPANDSDAFRMMFLGDETPPFESYRLRVIGSEETLGPAEWNSNARAHCGGRP